MGAKLFRSTLLIAVTCTAMTLVGCLPFPLGDPEKSQMDPKLAGYWLADQEHAQTLVTLYPFDAHTYSVHTAECKVVGGEFELSEVQLYKGWLTPVDGATFITLEPLSQRLPHNASEDKVYLVARLVSEGGGLLVKGISDESKLFSDAKSAQDVEAIIRQNLDNPGLYANEPTRYRHLDPEKDKATLEPLLKAMRLNEVK